MEFLPLLNFYFTVAFFVMIVNAVIAGYKGMSTTWDDVIQSALWPISLAALLGTLIRIGVQSYEEAAKKPQKKKDPK